jgi:hypothetical protein
MEEIPLCDVLVTFVVYDIDAMFGEKPGRDRRIMNRIIAQNCRINELGFDPVFWGQNRIDQSAVSTA